MALAGRGWSPRSSVASLESFSSLSFDADLQDDEHGESDDDGDDAEATLAESDDSGDGADNEEMGALRRPPRSPQKRSARSRSPPPRQRSTNNQRSSGSLCGSPRLSARTTIQPPGQHDRTRQLHFHALFVRVDPPLLRSLRHLELSGLNLKRTDLLVVTTNLFLLETLKSISLADNQLEDSCVKEIRTIVSLGGLDHVDLSKNLLGRGAARMIAERLRHGLGVKSLDVSGNPRFFAFDDANDVARALAQGLAANKAIMDFREAATKPSTSQRRRGRSFGPPSQSSFTDRDSQAAAAEAFTRELCELKAGPSRMGSGLYSIGLVHAELPRRTIVNLMKLANQLVVLDLSFAFVGIAAAQVIATALKMKDYATLTQLNLRGNRLKSMGTRAICEALHVNARLTDLNLSHNDLRSESVPDLTALLTANHTLVRLDLTQNGELFRDVEYTSNEWQALTATLQLHQALLSLGALERIQMTEAQRTVLKQVLEEAQQRSDERVLLGVHHSMAFETPPSGRDGSSLVGFTQAVTLSQLHQREKTIWRLRRELAAQSRVSIKWKMTAFVPPSTAKNKTEEFKTPSLQHGQQRLIRWRVIVHRKCDLATCVDYDAANGTFALASSPSQSRLILCSAVVYCDQGDTMSIVVSIPNDDEDEDDEGISKSVDTVKVLAKEFVVLPHTLTLRHLAFHFDVKQAPDAASVAKWHTKSVRNPKTDMYPFTTDLVVTYIARTAKYRIVWRVHVASVCITGVEQAERSRLLETDLVWRVMRSHCWDSDVRAAVYEGSSHKLDAIVRNGQELVVATQPADFVAGEIVHLRAETMTDRTAIRLLQFFVLTETATWEHAQQTRQR